MSFTKLVEEILEETTVIGGANSCMGPNVTKTASAKSGDKYESGDARVPKSIYGGVITRFGMTNKKKGKKKK